MIAGLSCLRAEILQNLQFISKLLILCGQIEKIEIWSRKRILIGWQKMPT
jgi:DNA-binding transcriptional regulator/RsmH inhibitor MraZ